jgi:hypothetical protein
MFSAPQVNIYSADVARALDFYRGLGFEETFRTPHEGAPIHVEFVLDGFNVGVAAVTSGYHDWLGSLRVAWVADPDDNPIELVQRRA